MRAPSVTLTWPLRNTMSRLRGPRLLEVRAAVFDLQPQLLGEGCGHDDQRQAVAPARLEGLGGIAGDGRVVLEHQMLALVQRVDQRLLAPEAARAAAISVRAYGASHR
jgi:hypothetical protein